MNNLQERVQKMLEGEKKRREIALKWVEEITEILTSVGKDMWGGGDSFGGELYTNTITLTKINKDNKKKNTDIYFRYDDHYGTDDTECSGFYDCSETQCNVWGTSIDELNGKEFWYAIQVIIDWIPQVIEGMNKREKSRSALLKKIK